MQSETATDSTEDIQTLRDLYEQQRQKIAEAVKADRAKQEKSLFGINSTST